VSGGAGRVQARSDAGRQPPDDHEEEDTAGGKHCSAGGLGCQELEGQKPQGKRESYFSCSILPSPLILLSETVMMPSSALVARRNAPSGTTFCLGLHALSIIITHLLISSHETSLITVMGRRKAQLFRPPAGHNRLAPRLY